MIIFNASDYGIVPNNDITLQLIELINKANKTNGEKTIVFEKGTYYIDSEKCSKYMLYITNTVGDKEFSSDEKPHLNAVPFYFGGINDLIFDGSDSVFVIDGKVTNIAVENCKNITVKNAEIRHAHPDMHELKVVNKTMFYVDFEIDRDSLYKISGNKITVRFMHPQSHGFNPLRKGDKIAFIKPDDLLEYGSAVIESTKLLNEYEIELTLDSAKGAVKGDVIEDISACPDVLFKNNVLNRIITRGLLLTTRGKVLVEDNHFKSNYMSTILLSDDAKSWYESGMCRDVTIKNNQFDYCGAVPVLIKPENKKHNGAVHKNIKIINNRFNSYKGYAVSAKSSDNILISDNKFLSDKILKSVNCGNVTLKNNDTV